LLTTLVLYILNKRSAQIVEKSTINN